MVRIFTAVIFLCVAGCTFSPQLHIHDTPQQTHEVYKDEYIFIASGPFNPWKAGEKNTPVFPAGTYSVDQFDNYKLLKVNPSAPREVVPYRPEDDYCLKNGIKNCYPNYVVRTLEEPLESKQWAPKALRVTDQVSPDVNIAIIDTGVDCEHEEITCAAEFDARTAQEKQGAARDDNGHGTHVAGIACANGQNRKGIRGISRECKITAIKFLNADGSGSVFDALRGIEYAIEKEVDIINASFGGGGRLEPLQRAITKANEQGIIFIAAAGNERNNNDNKPTYPANYDGVVSVASTDKDGALSSFSNYGRNSVAFAAPGGQILSTYPSNKYVVLSGTSMAAPALSGLAAVYLHRFRSTHPGKLGRSRAVLQHLQSTATDAKALPTRYGRPRLVDGEGSLPVCKERQCIQCIDNCRRDYGCEFHRQRRCRKECRNQTNCVGQCKPKQHSQNLETIELRNAGRLLFSLTNEVYQASRNDC